MLATDIYGPTVRGLLNPEPPNELGPGRPNIKAHPALSDLTPERLVTPLKLHDRQMALAALAGLWLRHDYFDESHAISQDLETLEGSYWHGILHRREPDYGNARYWMRRVPSHPIHTPLLAGAQTLAAAGDLEPEVKAEWNRTPLNQAASWDSSAFVGFCERSRRGPAALDQFARRIQSLEWELLFEYCFRAAAAVDRQPDARADEIRSKVR